MIHLETVAKLLASETGFRVTAERFELWRLCSRAGCRRGRACRDWRQCGARFAAWAKAVQDVTRRQSSGDLEAEAMRAELLERLTRMNQPEEGEA